MAVDWSFLKDVETNSNVPVTKLFVPKRDGKAIQNSGITFGTGIDLGQQSAAKWRKLGISEEIIERFKPFFGKSQDKALKALQDNPDISITEEEVFAIDRKIKQDTLRQTKKWYNKDNTLGQDFSDLSDRQQTVMVSVVHNHGLGDIPNFKKQVETGDWSAAIENLRNFYKSDKNELHSRRVKEAQYLAGLPPKEIDGIDGKDTAAAVEKFKNTVGVSTPDEVRPEQPQIGSVNYLDNIMATIQSRLSTPPQARTEPRNKVDELIQLVDEDMSQEQVISRGEQRLAKTYKEVTQPKKKQFSEEDEKKIQELMSMGGERVVLRETTNPTPEGKPEPEVREDDPSKDPIYGLF